MSDAIESSSSELQHLRRTLPAGTEDVIRYAREHPSEFNSIYAVVRDTAVQAEQRTSSKYRKKLIRRFESLQDRSTFGVGDLVVWKAGLKNKRRPDYDEPAIVVEVLSEPIIVPRDEAGSAYFREPLDLLLGILDEDDELVIVHFDSRRFVLQQSKETTSSADVEGENGPSGAVAPEGPSTN